MITVEMSQIVGNLQRDLNSSLGVRNIVDIAFDEQLGPVFENEAMELIAAVKQIAVAVAANLENGILNIELRLKDQMQSMSTIEIAFDGIGTPDLTFSSNFKTHDEILEHINKSTPGIDLRISMTGNSVKVKFRVLVTKVVKVLDDGLHAFMNKRILLAEDNDVNVIVFSNFLEGLGTKNTIANNGREAVELSKKNKFDAILMDIHMPVMSGIDAIRELRKTDQETPIIVLSGINFQSDIDAALAAGANAFLKKPVSTQELYAAIAKAVLKPDEQ